MYVYIDRIWRWMTNKGWYAINPTNQPTIPLPNLWKSSRVYQLKLVSPSLSCSIGFSVLWQSPSTCFSFHFLWFSFCGPSRRQSSRINWFPFFFLLLTITRSGHLSRIRWSVCISKFKKILCSLFYRTDSRNCITNPSVSRIFTIFHYFLFGKNIYTQYKYY